MLCSRIALARRSILEAQTLKTVSASKWILDGLTSGLVRALDVRVLDYSNNSLTPFISTFSTVGATNELLGCVS
jgi:hypothetical protein